MRTPNSSGQTSSQSCNGCGLKHPSYASCYGACPACGHETSPRGGGADDDLPELITVDEVSQRLSIPAWVIWRAINAEIIPSYDIIDPPYCEVHVFLDDVIDCIMRKTRP